MEISAKEYLTFIQGRSVDLLNSVDSIGIAADAAAERVVSGGRLYGLGDEIGFQSEYSSRAGGLMGIQTVADDVAEGDVIVAATTDNGGDTAYRDTLADYRRRGALVILIGSRESAEKGVEDIFIDNHLGRGLSPVFDTTPEPLCPAAGVCNVAALWTFTAEYVSACTRRGKMPVCWQSGCLDAGRDRNALLMGKVFHEDGEFDVPAIDAGEKGREFLYNLLRCLSGIGSMEIGKFEQAGQLAARSVRDGATVWCDVIGHHLPSQRGIPGDPGLFTIGSPEKKEETGPFKDGDVYLYNGYFMYPSEQLAKVREAGIPSVWILGGREVQDVYAQPGEIHINAYWRYGDASLTIPGYDLRIIPVSGAIMTATLWMLLAETAGATGR